MAVSPVKSGKEQFYSIEATSNTQESSFGFARYDADGDNAVKSNVHVDLRVHAITSIDVKNSIFTMDGRIEVQWTDNSPAIRDREKEYALAKQHCNSNSGLKLGSNQERYEWNEGMPTKQVEHEDGTFSSQNWDGLVRTVVIKNLLSETTVYEPYMTHYLEGQTPDKPKSYEGHNVRFIVRKLYVLRMFDVELQSFPLDYHNLPIEFRMPRTSDRDCKLNFEVGVKYVDGTLKIGRGPAYPRTLSKEAKKAGKKLDDSTADDDLVQTPAGLWVDPSPITGWNLLYPLREASYMKKNGTYNEVGTDKKPLPIRDGLELRVDLSAAREPYQYLQFMKLTFCFGTISLYTYAIPSDETADRGSISFTLMLTLTTFQFLILSELPKVPHATMLDHYMQGSFVLLLLVIVENGLIHKLELDTEGDGREVAVDFYFYCMYALVWFGFNIYTYFRVRRLRMAVNMLPLAIQRSG